MRDPHPLHSFVPGRPHWWQWLTVLSLDAPLVAMIWQWAVARVAGVTLRSHHAFILGAAAWLAYAADRWIEGWRIDPAQVQTQRHWFYQARRWPMAALWILVLTVALWLSLTRLTRPELDAGLWLLAPVLLYLLSHQCIHRDSHWRVPKEICVALLFTLGVACFPFANNPAMVFRCSWPLGLFGLLCFANCALISLWENAVDRTHGQISLALQFPRGRLFVRALPWAIAGLGSVLAWRASSLLADVIGCAALSGALLGVLDFLHRRLGRQLSRALVDVTLMTPSLLLVWDLFARA